MTCRKPAPAERYMLAALRRQGLNRAESARSLGRHGSTVCRAPRRKSTCSDGRYRRFSAEDFALVDESLCRQWRDKKEGGPLYTPPAGREGRGWGYRTPLECFDES